MNRTIVSVGIITLLASLATIANAKGPKKPVVCLSFTEQTMAIEGESQKVAICTDRAKPVILTTYTVTTVKNDEGTAVRAVVGYR